MNDPYIQALDQQMIFLIVLTPASRCPQVQRVRFLLLSRLFWFKHPIRRELPQWAASMPPIRGLEQLIAVTCVMYEVERVVIC